jgi:phage terminase small subunit
MTDTTTKGKPGRPRKSDAPKAPPDYPAEYAVLIGGLTIQDSVFVNAYCANGFNATRAAETAKLGGTYGAWRVNGSKKLAQANIKSAIDKRLEEFALSKATILARLAAQATADIGELLDEEGHLNLKDAKARGILANAQEISIRYDKEGNQVAKVKMYSAQRALEVLGHAMGALKWNQDVNGVLSLRDAMGMTEDDDDDEAAPPNPFA